MNETRSEVTYKVCIASSMRFVTVRVLEDVRVDCGAGLKFIRNVSNLANLTIAKYTHRFMFFVFL